MGSAMVAAPVTELQGATEGNETSVTFAELYRRFGPKVHARCRRLLHERQTAEDATQEIFLKLMLRPSSLLRAEATWSFIRRVTTNHCLNQLRNETRRREARLVLDTFAPPPADRIADRQLVSRILAHVPAELSVVGWLNHVDELDQRDIAERLSISRRTVVSRLSSFNARAKRVIASPSKHGARPLAPRVERGDDGGELAAHGER